MSGGHFGDYDYYKVAQFADELEEEILKNGQKREDGGYYGKNTILPLMKNVLNT